jgi:hypothetical protein
MYIKRAFAICVLLLSVLFVSSVFADERSMNMGGYQIVEGKVTTLTARMMVIDNQQYPISKFVRVYDGDEKGQEIPMHTVVSIGKIDKAIVYLLGGKVEKIIVIKNI